MYRFFILLLLGPAFSTIAIGDSTVDPDERSTTEASQDTPLSRDPFLSDPFLIPIKLYHAQTLFDARRYRDAEAEFTELLQLLKTAMGNDYQTHFDNYVRVLDYLAQSRSQQGKTLNVRELLTERHELIKSAYDSNGFQFANSLFTLAEAHYRSGDRAQAIALLEGAVRIYVTLNPVPKTAVERARMNRIQYRIATFSNSMLPMDLSEFYSQCEAIQTGDQSSHSVVAMEEFVEVGTDYIPEGSWAVFFDNLKYPTVSAFGGDGERRIFIPSSVETMRDEICIVETREGTVISAESFVD